MRLETALHTSREGLTAHGQAISVIGDNISNGNTTGYKQSRVEFGDLLPEGRDSTAAETTIPNSGSGVMIQEVRTLFEDGIVENTGRRLDAAVAGSGFFLVGDPAGPALTRAGNFGISSDGFLVTTEGERVLGYPPNSDGTVLSEISMVDLDLTGNPTSEISLVANLQSGSALTAPPENPLTFGELGTAASFPVSFEVYDSLGTPQNVSVYFFKTDLNTWSAQAYVDSGQTGGEAGVPQLVGTLAGLTFNNNGEIDEANAANAILQMNTTFTGAEASTIALNLGSMTQFALPSQVTNVTRNGQQAGAIQGYEILSDGILVAELDSGAQVEVATLALGRVQNEDGLRRVGSNNFVRSTSSGDLVLGRANADGFGGVEGSALERSTVDLSTEFVTLVLIQRGYQANAQILSATNEMLQQAIQQIG